MGELGSIFDAVPNPSGNKGPDLRVRATVYRDDLEGDEGVLVEVPDQVPHGEGTVPRRRGPDDPRGAVRLFLSPQLGEQTTLRLRGQGGEHPRTGNPGDLLLTLTVVAGAGPRRAAEGGSVSGGGGWLVPLLVAAAVALTLVGWKLWGG